jgi:hypothetical protein
MHNFNDQPLNDQLVAPLRIFRNHTGATIIARYSSSPIRSHCAKGGLLFDLGSRREDTSVRQQQTEKSLNNIDKSQRTRAATLGYGFVALPNDARSDMSTIS